MLTAEGLMHCILSGGLLAHQNLAGPRLDEPSHDALGPR
jgi:hypothetical protein